MKSKQLEFHKCEYCRQLATTQVIDTWMCDQCIMVSLPHELEDWEAREKVPWVYRKNRRAGRAGLPPPRS